MLKRFDLSFRVEALKGYLAQREQLGYEGSSLAERELAKAEAQLKAVEQEQPQES